MKREPYCSRFIRQSRILSRKREYGDRALTHDEIRKVLSNSRFVDLAGRRFGKLLIGTETFIKADSKGRTQRYWVCTCDCGQTKAIRAASLIAAHSKSCSAVLHRRTRFVDLTGRQFGNGKIVVLGYAGVGVDINTGKRYRQWRCKCSCGTFFITRATSLLQGKTRSCSCLRTDKARARFRALHFIERQMGKQAIAGMERLSQMNHANTILKNALGSLPSVPDKGRSV